MTNPLYDIPVRRIDGKEARLGVLDGIFLATPGRIRPHHDRR